MIATSNFYALFEERAMKTSQRGIDLIKEFEGCRLTGYADPVGIPTIGYGHTGPEVEVGMKILQTQADAYLREDLERFERTVSKTGLDLTQNEFDALVSFAYNTGEANLRRLVKGRTLVEIAAKFTAYNRAGGKVLDGLTRRRKAEQALFRDGMKSDYAVAIEVLDGMWGSGATRKSRLTAAGYSYGNVQKEVNRIISDDGR